MTEATHLGTRDPARLPHCMSLHEERHLQLELACRAIDRFTEIQAILDGRADELPRSRLHLVAAAPGSLLFKGGRADA